MLEELAEAAFGAGLSLVSRVAAVAPAAGIEGSGRRVLVIAPHPDDECAGCAGTMLLHQRAGDRVHLVTVTDGRASRALPISAGEMAGVRRREAAEAARRLHVASHVSIDLPELEWATERLVPELAQVMEAIDPELVYAPSRVDAHPEHLRVAEAFARALGRPRGSLEVRAYQALIPLTPALVDVAIDVSGVAGELEAAMRAHESQWRTLERTLRLRRYAARAHGAEVMAEEFWRMDGAAYRRLHHDALATRDDRRWFGLQVRPYRDPLAFGKGLWSRWRLARERSRVVDGSR